MLTFFKCTIKTRLILPLYAEPDKKFERYKLIFNKQRPPSIPNRAIEMNVFTGDHLEESLFINLVIMSPEAIDPNVYSSKNSDRS